MFVCYSLVDNPGTIYYHGENESIRLKPVQYLIGHCTVSLRDTCITAYTHTIVRLTDINTKKMEVIRLQTQHAYYDICHF